MDAFEVIVTAVSNRELESREFNRQVEFVKPHVAWDQATWSWEMRLSGARAEHATDVLNTLFEAARVYGTAVTVRRAPTEQAGEVTEPG
ncbi:hypothetical protein HCN51_55655 [Nonomuraea sp. FMUSA5-5]|uniref:Uncharacterized protein n=1 Tax=Nonomuraea composti TaxID=2720023 RepID=A0ABX1BLF2_9ACTN|nr:hypothetical protein [Nonomuraea sp. FMUSA5-5]NJP98561.1 hypothetical protein [Nonomuraea sp. FMUSA5-5]